MAAAKIPMTTVQSSNIHAVGYDGPTRTLAVHFRSGDIWHFPGVEPDLAQRFIGAESKGKFFYANIKGKFSTALKMTGECPACGDRGWIGDECADCGTQRYVREDDRSVERPRAAR